jgi:hypothetical protein
MPDSYSSDETNSNTIRYTVSNNSILREALKFTSYNNSPATDIKDQSYNE